MDWFKLVKGDENNLEGRVIVYSVFKPRGNNSPSEDCNECEDKEKCYSIEKEGYIFALYGTGDLEAYAEKMGAPEEFIKLESLKHDSISKLSELFGIKAEVKEFYASPIEVKSEEELLSSSGPEDIISVGEYHNPSGCIKMVEVGMQSYLVKYVEQLVDKETDTETEPKCKEVKSFLKEKKLSRKEKLQTDLDRMLRIENFEEAARLRDKIKKLNSKKKKLNSKKKR